MWRGQSSIGASGQFNGDPQRRIGLPHVFLRYHGAERISWLFDFEPMSNMLGEIMGKNASVNSGQILLFPSASPGTAPSSRQSGDWRRLPSSGANLAVESQPLSDPLPLLRAVLSGSYRKDLAGLKSNYEELLDIGCRVLSPSNVTVVSESDGFVYMQGEEAESPDVIEGRHLDSIQQSDFVWLHAPDGYVGPTASLEIGFANALGVPVFSKERVKDSVIQSFVREVSSPAKAIEFLRRGFHVPRPPLAAFQDYYRRVAIQRGYNSEGPKDCLVLMVEEVGELCRAIRKREGLVRHGTSPQSNEGLELADVFLYVVHMANVLDVDLSKLVQDKELINLQKFLHR
jgi:NTP pyrophosphatase (non-canonical NTP hydrolase)